MVRNLRIRLHLGFILAESVYRTIFVSEGQCVWDHGVTGHRAIASFDLSVCHVFLLSVASISATRLGGAWLWATSDVLSKKPKNVRLWIIWIYELCFRFWSQVAHTCIICLVKLAMVAWLSFLHKCRVSLVAESFLRAIFAHIIQTWIFHLHCLQWQWSRQRTRMNEKRPTSFCLLLIIDLSQSMQPALSAA